MAAVNPATEWVDPRRARLAGLESAEAADLANRMPRILAKAREVAGSLVHGAHGRRRAGTGETFWQYRPFQAGESAHRVDWRRSARGDQLFVREREWEAALNYFLWVDLSASMSFKSQLAADYKIDRAAVLGLAAADVLVRSGERVGALGLTNPIASRNVAERLAEALAESAASGAPEKTPPEAPLPSRARLLLISDFLCDVEALGARLSAYAGAGARGALVMVLDPVEESFPFAGETLFRDPMGGAPYRAGEAGALQQQYLRALAEHRAALADAARRSGFLFLVHHTDRPAAEAGLALLMGLSEGAEASAWG
jgi:uncharacterized protein (DUF58 family)